MAAITASVLTSGGGSGGDFNTASISPTANRLILLAISVADGVTVNGVTGNGLTWVEVGNDHSDQHRTYVFRAMGSSPSTGVVSVDLSGSARRSWGIVEFANVNTTGTNGSGAIVQTAKAANGDSGNVTTRTATLAAFSSTDNAPFGASGWNGNSGATSISPGSGFTELTDADGTSDSFHTLTQTEFRNDNDTTVDSSTSTAGRYCLFAIEIANASTMPSSGFFNLM